MFWSLILEPGKKYSQVVEDSFHLSMAVLDLSSVPTDGKAANFPVQLEIDSQKLILCNLSKDLHPQVQLDLNFEKGTHLNLFTSGKAVIHLTGYLDNLSLDSDDSPLDSDDSDLSDEENEDLDVKTNSKKSVKSMIDKSAAAKRKLLVENENRNKKKPKIEKNESSDSDSDADSDNDVEEEASDDEIDEDMSDEIEEDDDFGDNLSDEEEDDSDDESSIPTLQDFINKEKQSKAQAKVAKQHKKLENNKTPITGKKTPSGDKKTPQQMPAGNKNEKQKGNAMNNVSVGTTTPASAKQKTGKQDSTPGHGKTASPKGTPKKQTLQGGVLVEELKEGNGPVAKPGKMVTVYYTGRLQNNNKVFDQTNQGPGFKFRLGRGDVIKGWDVALNGMKVGSKRKITIPPAMAYGNKGQPPAVPPNSTLVFDVEIRSVK